LRQENGLYEYQSIFISDIHLGTRGCQAEMLLDFLSHTKAETIYLVGDIFDGWQLERAWYWPQSHDAVVQALLERASNGTRIIYLAGNHDEVLRKYCGTHLAGVEVTTETIHETADGKRFLVVHGDAFDGVVLYARWLAVLGHFAYGAALRLNTLFNHARKFLGMDYWSLSAWLKFKVKNAVQFISNFETALVQEAKRVGADGVICGHIHHAEHKIVDGTIYINDGDWVESCTALVEHHDGSMEILHWADIVKNRQAQSKKSQWQKAAA